jgi:hypothetical protein
MVNYIIWISSNEVHPRDDERYHMGKNYEDDENGL